MKRGKKRFRANNSFAHLLGERHFLVVLLVEVDEGLAVVEYLGQLDGPEQVALAVDGTETEERRR